MNRFIALAFTSLFLALFTSVSYSDNQLSLYFDDTEGGQISSKRFIKLKKHLNKSGCSVNQVIRASELTSERVLADVIFIPLKASTTSTSFDSLLYTEELKNSVVNSEPLTVSILVRGSTGISNLASLDGVKFAFVSPNSLLGYQIPNQLLRESGVKTSNNNITFTGTSLGSISLLLHKDVFATVIPTPLAISWAKANDLTVVAKTKAVEAGSVWFKKSMNKKHMKVCKKVFTQLHRNKSNKRLAKLFPQWLNGFKPIK